MSAARPLNMYQRVARYVSQRWVSTGLTPRQSRRANKKWRRNEAAVSSTPAQADQARP